MSTQSSTKEFWKSHAYTQAHHENQRLSIQVRNLKQEIKNLQDMLASYTKTVCWYQGEVQYLKECIDDITSGPVLLGVQTGRSKPSCSNCKYCSTTRFEFPCTVCNSTNNGPTKWRAKER